MFKFNVFRFDFLQRSLTFCIRLIWFLSAICVDMCKHCVAILFFGLFSECIQNLMTFKSVSPFSGNRRSSFLQAMFKHCLFIIIYLELVYNQELVHP